MISIFILAAALSDQTAACSTAVHSDLPTAVTACGIGDQKIDVFASDGLTEACAVAFSSGRQVGKIGPNVPAVTRDALVKDFDRKMNACLNPKPTTKTPVLKTTNLWD